MGTILIFIIYALRPLSKTADIWNIKDIVQTVIIILGWGGGGWIMTINTALAVGILVGIPALLFLIAGIKLQFKVNKYNMRKVELVFDPDLYPSCRCSCIRQEGVVTTIYRVGLRAKGNRTVYARVELARFTPQNANFLPQPLTPMDIPIKGEGWVEVNPSGTPNQFINVVEWALERGEIAICYHRDQENQRLWPNMIPVREYMFTLLVQVRDDSYFEEDFLVNVENGELVFRKVRPSQVSHKKV